MELYKSDNRNNISSQKHDDSEQIKTRIFSDNIVLYSKINDDITGCFLHLINLTAYIQGVFLVNGLLVRGGIAMGDFFADEVMIWGSALVNSYYIENSISIYPRIVIHPHIINSIENKYIDNNILINCDEDGYYYVDYLKEELFYSFASIMEKANVLCECELKKAHYGKDNENIKVVQKIIWQKNYIKRCVEGARNTLEKTSS